MKRSNSNIKKILTFSQNKTYLSGNETLHFSAQAWKKKNPLRENFLYATTKKFIIFSLKKMFLYSRKGKKFFYIFSEETFSYILGIIIRKIKRTHSENPLLYFGRWNFKSQA